MDGVLASREKKICVRVHWFCYRGISDSKNQSEIQVINSVHKQKQFCVLYCFKMPQWY